MTQALAIVPYDPQFKAAFKSLNVEWLETYFVVEPEDVKNLEDPEKHIIDNGGEIFFAVLDGEAIGTVALKYHEHGRYEISKMAVRPGHQGMGIGRKLMVAALDCYNEKGGKELFLETSSKLPPAIALYKKMGFVEEPISADTPYERADYGMIYRP